jgi:hypothetical protein
MSDEIQTPENEEHAADGGAKNAEPQGSDLESTIRKAYDRLPSIVKQRRRLLWVVLGYIGGIISIVSIGIMVMWSTAETNISERQTELVSHLKHRGEQLWNSYSKAAAVVAKDVLPGVEDQLMEALADAQRNLPAALDKATLGMEKRLTESMNKKVQEAQIQAMESQRTKLKNLMPDLFHCKKGESPESCKKKDDTLDLLMVELMKSYKAWAVSELRTTFSGHLKAMDDIGKTMAKFTPGRLKKGESPAKVSMTTAPGDMLSLWMELVAESLAGSNELFEPTGK